MHFSKHLFSSWKPTKQSVESKTQQNKHKILAHQAPEIRFLLKMLQNFKNEVKNHALFKTPFSSWKPTKQTIESNTQPNKHGIPANQAPEIRFLLEMLEKTKNDVKKHALFQTPFFLLETYQIIRVRRERFKIPLVFAPVLQINRSGSLFLSLKTFQSLRG